MFLRRTILPILVGLCLSMAACPAYAADNVAIIVDLPSLTRETKLSVQGKTVPGSSVQSGANTVKADGAGNFTIPVELVEGDNSILVRATTPTGNLLQWTGSITRDTIGPAVYMILPDESNTNYFKLSGRTEAGARMYLNGHEYSISSGGSFEMWVDIEQNNVLKMLFVDPAGNRTELEHVVRLIRTNPWWLTWRPYVPVFTKAAPGTRVSDPNRPELPPITVGEDGQVRWIHPIRGLVTHFFLKFEPPGGKPYFHLYDFTQYLHLDLPDETHLASLSLPGRVERDHTLRIDGIPVVTDSQGRFTFKRDLKWRQNVIQFEVTTPSGRILSNKVTVMRTTFVPRFYQNDWLYTTGSNRPGGIFQIRTGTERYSVLPNGKGALSLRLPSSQIANGVHIDGFYPDGTVLTQYWQVSNLAGRTVKMFLERTDALVDGQEIALTVPPQLLDGTTYVPLRSLADALKADLTWDGATNTATFELNGRTLAVTLNHPEAKVDGQIKLMSAPARLVESRTMVPLRFISENLGAEVKWDGATRGITITIMLP